MPEPKKNASPHDAELIESARVWIRRRFEGESSGHDAAHTLRVTRLAMSIAEQEGADLITVELAALLHDADDRKLFGGQFGQTPAARAFLTEQGCSLERTDLICRIISEISFKGRDSQIPESLEGKIVQDADRLDAIGAIGIGRAFAYGGSRGRQMHDPAVPPKTNLSAAEYAANQGTTINHFYEKLLLLKDQMNTKAAQQLAQHRHQVMTLFLDEFLAEWDAKQ